MLRLCSALPSTSTSGTKITTTNHQSSILTRTSESYNTNKELLYNPLSLTSKASRRVSNFSQNALSFRDFYLCTPKRSHYPHRPPSPLFWLEWDLESEIGLRSKTAQGCKMVYNTVVSPRFNPESSRSETHSTTTIYLIYTIPKTPCPRPLQAKMPPPKYNPSSYTTKTKPNPLTPGIPAFEKSNNRFTSGRAKERDFQRWCQTHSDDDLVDSLGKMGMGGDKAGKKWVGKSDVGVSM